MADVYHSYTPQSGDTYLDNKGEKMTTASPPTTTYPTTTDIINTNTTNTDKTTETTLGVSGFVVFGLILGIIFYARHRCRNRIMSSATSSECDEDELKEVKVDSWPKKKNTYIRRGAPDDKASSSEFADFQKARIHRDISKSVLIENEWLDIGRKIGNGVYQCR